MTALADPTWRAYVEWEIGEVEGKLRKAKTPGDIFYYETCLVGWQAELRKLLEGDAVNAGEV